MTRINPRIVRGLLALWLFPGGFVQGANIIGQIDASFGFGAGDQPPPGLMYVVFQHHSTSQPYVALRPSLFENIPITPATIGHQYFVNAAVDADFPAVADHLTNGIDETLLIYQFEGPNITGPGTAWIRKESEYLGPAGNPDLVGQEIRAMIMTVVDYRHDVMQPVIGRSDFVDVTITVLGIPEPVSAGLLVLGTVLSAGGRVPRKVMG